MNKAPEFLVVPAAGLGTRMKKVHPKLPKEMLAIGSKPAIQYTVAEGFSVGIRRIIIVINHRKNIIRRYFEEPAFRKEIYPLAAEEMELFTKECEIIFLYQENPLGEADAIGLCRDLVNDAPLAIIYPDNLYFPAPGALQHLLPYFLHSDKDLIALNEVTPEIQATMSNAGRVDLKPLGGDLFAIKEFLAKGDGPFVPRFGGELRACGICLASGAHLFDAIDQARDTIKQGEFTDTPVRTLIMQQKGILGCRLPGIVFDIGNPRGYTICQQHMLSL